MTIQARPMEAARSAVARAVYDRIGAPVHLRPSLLEPPGDPGLFGPGSMVWRVHADLPSMLIGGIGALLLQTLHPLAMAGVDQHSDFRSDPFTRLQNTSSFIALTSFGSHAGAESAFARVREVHRSVHGVAPDGRPYSANDPALLVWVHVALVRTFLAAYQRYSGRPLNPAERDRYYGEVRVLATELGAHGVPASEKAILDYLVAVRPQLEATESARKTVRFLAHPPGPTAAERLLYPVLFGACVDLLPGWAREELQLPAVPPLQRALVRRAAGAVGSLMRWGVGTPMSVRWATQRVSAA